MAPECEQLASSSWTSQELLMATTAWQGSLPDVRVSCAIEQQARGCSRPQVLLGKHFTLQEGIC
jgi:hypothetical protein